MKLRVIFLLGLFFCGTALAEKVTSPIGDWVTISDKTHKPKGLVRISERNGKLEAKILKIYNPEEKSGLCKKCPGALKDKPILGLRFLWGMKPDGQNTWSGGEILDPKEGKIYRCKLSLDPSKNQLQVRGYIGISLFGRTQTWVTPS